MHIPFLDPNGPATMAVVRVSITLQGLEVITSDGKHPRETPIEEIEVRHNRVAFLLGAYIKPHIEVSYLRFLFPKLQLLYVYADAGYVFGTYLAVFTQGEGR